MAESTTTTKKRGRGRPPKEKPKEHKGWGGKRPGAGRKKGFKLVENPRNKGVTFMVSEKMLNQIRQLREATKEEVPNFNGMFVEWVEKQAKSYGIE